MTNYRTMAKTYRKSKQQPSLTPKELNQVQDTFQKQEKEIIEEMSENLPKESLEATKKRNMARMVARIPSIRPEDLETRGFKEWFGESK